MRFATFGNTRLQVRALLILIWFVWEKCFGYHTSCCVYLNAITSQDCWDCKLLSSKSIHPSKSSNLRLLYRKRLLHDQSAPFKGKELQWGYSWVKMRKVMQACKQWWTHLVQLDNISPEDEEEGTSLNPFLNWLFQEFRYVILGHITPRYTPSH